VVREADAIPEDRAFRERARGVHRDNPDPPVFLPVELYELGDDAALANAGRSREAYGEGASAFGVDLGDDTRRLGVLAFYLGDDPRQRPPVAGEQPLDQAPRHHPL
jgi:hypothetical protein